MEIINKNKQICFRYHYLHIWYTVVLIWLYKKLREPGIGGARDFNPSTMEEEAGGSL